MNNGIDTIDTPEVPIEELQKIAPETAGYCELFLRMFEDYSVESYSAHPEEALSQCQNLDNDITDIIDQAEQDLAKLDSLGQHQFKAALTNFFHFLNENRPVAAYLLREFFEAFDIRTIAPQEVTEGKPVRYKVDNFIIKSKDIKTFFRELGLIYRSTEGDHEKWDDPISTLRRPAVINIRGKNIHFKSVVRELLADGIPLTKIELACKKLGLQFHYVTS